MVKRDGRGWEAGRGSWQKKGKEKKWKLSCQGISRSQRNEPGKAHRPEEKSAGGKIKESAARKVDGNEGREAVGRQQTSFDRKQTYRAEGKGPGETISRG